MGVLVLTIARAGLAAAGVAAPAAVVVRADGEQVRAGDDARGAHVHRAGEGVVEPDDPPGDVVAHWYVMAVLVLVTQAIS